MADINESILVEHEGDLCIVTLNRPDRLNAINAEIQADLTRKLAEADADEASKVIVITGAGRGFCAGGDIKGMRGTRVLASHRPGGVYSGGRRLMNTMLSIEKPIIAMVNGPAVGLGATIALLCDAVIMAEDARIGDSHVQVGLVAGDGGAVLWPLLIGPSRAKELLLTGRLITGTEAATMGLVSRAVPGDRLREETMALAAEFAALPPYAARATKCSVNRFVQWMSNLVLDQSLAYEQISKATDDHQEALAARAEKRKPKFTGS